MQFINRKYAMQIYKYINGKFFSESDQIFLIDQTPSL